MLRPERPRGGGGARPGARPPPRLGLGAGPLGAPRRADKSDTRSVSYDRTRRPVALPPNGVFMACYMAGQSTPRDAIPHAVLGRGIDGVSQVLFAILRASVGYR
jgi:hypothetical protein